MNRLRAVLFAVPLAGLALVGCGVVDRVDEAARVGDRVLTNEQVQAVANSPVAGGPLDGTVAQGDLARRIVTLWIRDAALADEDWFATIDAAQVRADLEAQGGEAFITSDAFTQQLLVDNGIVLQAVNRQLISEEEALALVAAAEVEVDARYGRWDPTSYEVVALAG
ncbi:MAG: hypothetical protein ACO3C1_07940 [Ilumatobacteraceae bacterium]